MLNNKLRSLIFSCNISVVCNKLYVVLNNESENKMKAINFVFSILQLTLLSLNCDTHEMNIQRQTSVISNFLYIEVFTQVPWTSIYPSFTVFYNNKINIFYSHKQSKHFIYKNILIYFMHINSEYIIYLQAVMIVVNA